MTVTNALLIVALIGMIALLWRTYRRYLIVRHLFIRSSDWCALKIEEMTEAATDEIMEMAKHGAGERGFEISDDDARDHVPDVIREAFEKWRKQKDGFQERLREYGIPPLNAEDDDDFALMAKVGLRTSQSRRLPAE